MSKKLPPERKAKAAGPLAPVQKDFIAVHLARGASPAAIRDVMNNLSPKSRDTLRYDYRMPSFQPTGRRERTWADLAGTRLVTLADVRRVYDAQRKTPGLLNESRREKLEKFRVLDARNRALAPVTNLHYTATRKLHDLAFARRFGANREMLQKIAEEDLIPKYLDFN